jgi:hypothetical protein
MFRFLSTALLLVLAIPAFAKSHNGTYSVPCSALWPAVADTLNNAGNYTIIGLDDDDMKASFIVVGATHSPVNATFLVPKDGGCELQVKMGFTGADDEGAFRKRVDHAFTKMAATQPHTPAKPTGQE